MIRASVAWVALGVAACSGSAPPGSVAPAADPCLLAADPTATRLDTVTIAVTGQRPGVGEPGAWPFAGPLIERHLSAESPPTDCEGRPGLSGAPGAAPFALVTRLGDAIVLAPADSTVSLRLRFVALRPGQDERDALDGQGAPTTPRVDVLVTRDARTIGYARQRAEFVTVPLAWDRTYGLAAAGASIPGPEARAALARDAVRADARGAEPPFPWLDGPQCAAGPGVPANASPIVAYVTDDPIARDLAARIVALAGMDRPALWLGRLSGLTARSLPLPADSLDSALRRGRVSGVVTAWPKFAPSSCGLPGLGAGGWAPLVDSRAHLIVRRGAPSLRVAGDGTFRFVVGPDR